MSPAPPLKWMCVCLLARACRRIAVTYAGRILETGPTTEVLARPAHPYTMGLGNGVLGLREARKEIVSIPGHPPRLDAPIVGCAFAPRCPFAADICRTATPALDEIAPGHASACHFRERAAELRPKAAEPLTWGSET